MMVITMMIMLMMEMIMVTVFEKWSCDGDGDDNVDDNKSK